MATACKTTENLFWGSADRVFTWRDIGAFERDFQIPIGITRIDDVAFAGQCELEYVTIPDSVTKMRPGICRVH